MLPSDRGLLFIVSSPSGGGKTTLIKHAMRRLEQYQLPSYFSVSHTTRSRRPATSDPPRPGEVDGADYHFVDRPCFEAMADRGEFLEWAEYAGALYGTARAEVEGRLAAGVDVFLDIEVQGANQVKTVIPEAVKIFVYPPSYTVLKDRLLQRRQDSADAVHRRLQWAVREFGVAGEFDYAIINDRLDEAVDVLVGICLAEHHRSQRLKHRLDSFREAFRAALQEDVTV